MAQPPDDRRPMPWDAPGAPPGAAPVPEPERLPADLPAEDAEGDSLEPPATPEADPRPSPLISWAPSGGAGAGQGAGAEPGTGTAGPDGTPRAVVGWEVPQDHRQASPIAGFVIAGTGSRLVAYLIDAVLLGIANYAILWVADPGLFDPAATITPSGVAPSLTVLLAQVVVLCLEFIYFVGFWTSRGRATLGMRLLRIRVTDARTGHRLSTVQAASRWLFLTGAIGLVGLLPIQSGIVGLASLLWLVILLATVLTRPLRQGIHDQVVGSLVLQREGVSSNAALVGCLLLATLFIVVPIILLIFLGAQIEEYLLEVGRSI